MSLFLLHCPLLNLLAQVHPHSRLFLPLLQFKLHSLFLELFLLPQSFFLFLNKFLLLELPFSEFLTHLRLQEILQLCMLFLYRTSSHLLCSLNILHDLLLLFTLLPLKCFILFSLNQRERLISFFVLSLPLSYLEISLQFLCTFLNLIQVCPSLFISSRVVRTHVLALSRKIFPLLLLERPSLHTNPCNLSSEHCL